MMVVARLITAVARGISSCHFCVFFGFGITLITPLAEDTCLRRRGPPYFRKPISSHLHIHYTKIFELFIKSVLILNK